MLINLAPMASFQGRAIISTEPFCKVPVCGFKFHTGTNKFSGSQDT